MCELGSFHASYSSGISPGKTFNTNALSKREVNGRLYIEEVGVDLELCVHAHGHDVDFIIKASLKIIISLV